MIRSFSPLAWIGLLLAVAFCVIVWTGFDYARGDAPDPSAWEQAARTLGVRNVVSGIYLGTRFFDTLLEVLVFAVAVLGVRFYLAVPDSADESTAPIPESHVVRVSANILLPLVLLIGLFVTINGHISPGGGFSGGAIAASGLLLVALALGGDGISERFHDERFERIEWGMVLALLALALLPVLFALPPLSNLLPSGRLGTLSSGGNVPLYNVLIGIKVFIASWVIIHHFLRHRGEI